MKKILSLLLAVAMMVSTFSFASAKIEDNTREGYGMNVSNFNARLLKSQEYLTGAEIADYKLTFINYWATWCGPCVGEMPHIRSMYEHFLETEENDVNVIGAVSISSSCTEESAFDFLKNNGYTWPNVIPDSVLNAVFNTSGYIPQTLIIDRNGIVRDHVVGSFPSYEYLMEYLEDWLNVLEGNDGEACTITYVNGATGEVLATEEAVIGEVFDAHFPSAPAVEGYTFTNQWDYEHFYETGYPTVRYLALGDATVTARYNIKRYLVRFVDSLTNQILSTQNVEHGSAAVPPEVPDHSGEGYYFVGWDADFSCITRMLTIHTVYRRVGDVNDDSQVDITDALVILRLAMQMLELDEENAIFADINMDGVVDITDAVLALRMSMGLI